MLLLDELTKEHELVDRVAGSLIRYAERAREGMTSEEDVADFVEFFRVFVAGFHHEREERTLFSALVERAEVPADRGPLPAIEADHRAALALVDEFEESAGDRDRAAGVARRLAHHLWEHETPAENMSRIRRRSWWFWLRGSAS